VKTFFAVIAMLWCVSLVLILLGSSFGQVRTRDDVRIALELRLSLLFLCSRW